MTKRAGAPAQAVRSRGREVQRSGFPLRWAIVIGLLVIVGVVVAILLLSGQESGTKVELMPTTEHVAPGTDIAYNTNPPTSGDHYGLPASWGVQKVAPADESIVHNMEHGGVIIYYKPDSLTPEQLTALSEQMAELSLSNHRLILTTRTDMPKPIAVTAWGFLLELDTYDADAIEDFVNDHINEGPECEGGQCPR